MDSQKNEDFVTSKYFIYNLQCSMATLLINWDNMTLADDDAAIFCRKIPHLDVCHKAVTNL